MEKEVITIKDLQISLGVSYGTAAKKMREARAVSDRLHISGIIHKLDWQDYLEFFKKKEDSVKPTTATLPSEKGLEKNSIVYLR